MFYKFGNYINRLVMLTFFIITVNKNKTKTMCNIYTYNTFYKNNCIQFVIDKCKII